MLKEKILLIAQNQLRLGPIGDQNVQGGLGPFGGAVSYGTRVGGELSGLMSKIIGVLTVAGGLWFMIQFLIGAFRWITSGGDKTNVEAAKEHLTHSVISLAILVSAYIIAGLVGAIFGLDLLNPQIVIQSLKP